MYEYIIGDVAWIKEDYIVLQNNNIGYKIFTSSNSSIKLQMGMKDVMIYTYYNLREDGVFLYGFTDEEEMDVFKLLITVSKIGPKVAIGILSGMTPNQIKLAIFEKNIPLLMKAPGVGKKTAERMILELKDKISIDDYLEEEEIVLKVSNDHEEAINGLMSLGYSRFEIENTLRSIETSKLSLEEIIRQSLKRLSKK